MWFKAIGFFLLSSVKFAVASLPIAASFGYLQSLIILISGGIFGVFFFLYIWKEVFYFWNIYIVKKAPEEKKNFKISKQKRRIVKLKTNYGYWGVILLTPIVLSIPIGAFLLMQYFKNKKFLFIHLSLSVMGWGTILISFFKFFENLFL